MLTSDEGDADEGNGEGIDNVGGNDNNHHSSMDMGSNMGSNRIEGNNMAQDNIAFVTVNNTMS